MKHPIRDRVILILSSVVLFVVACLGLLLVTGFAGRFINLNAWYLPPLYELRLPIRLCVGIGFGLLLVLSILNFATIFPPKKKKDLTYTIQHAENGELKISLEAISHLVNKCIEQHTELSDVQSKITSNEESVTVELHMTLSTDINIPMAVTALQKEIKQYVEATSGVHVDEVRVVVDSTARLMDGAAASPFVIPEMLQPAAAQEPLAVTDAPPTPPPPAEDDSNMYTFQDEPAYPSFTPPVNAYGDAHGDESPEEAAHPEESDEAAEAGMPEDKDSDAYLNDHQAQANANPETDVWMMGTPSLPSESEEEDEA